MTWDDALEHAWDARCDDDPVPALCCRLLASIVHGSQRVVAKVICGVEEEDTLLLLWKDVDLYLHTTSCV